jgi:hypothetical protein
METYQTETGWFHPFAGWDAAARWNRATFDWVATGWQQWVALMTTVPPQFMVPPTLSPDASQRVAEQVRAAHALDAQLRTREPVIASRAMARAEPRRAKSKAAVRTKPKKATTRG